MDVALSAAKLRPCLQRQLLLGKTAVYLERGRNGKIGRVGELPKIKEN